jgi:nitrate/nitrite-specific signal transduction histidine kinase
MLRRKLMLVIAPMVSILVLTAVLGIVLLQHTLMQVAQMNEGGLATVEDGNDFVISVRDVRRNLHEMALAHADEFDEMAASMKQASELLDRIEKSPLIEDARFDGTLGRVRQRFPEVQRQVDEIVTQHQRPNLDRFEQMIALLNSVDADVSHLCGLVRDQARINFDKLYRSFRLQLLAMGVVAILVVNLSILAFLRMAALILKPVDKLVAAARELGKERFETRITTDTDDEFGLLAQAYNGMAEQLEASERKRMEVLGQVGLALNHELNNVINIIELQLMLVSKRAEDRSALEGHLKQIRESLGRITLVVSELRCARRIVLTDYTAGLKMLDLRRSAEPIDPAEEPKQMVGAASGPHL